MRLDTVMLADHAVAAEGKLYINGGGITRINVPVLPFALPILSLVMRYMIESPEDRGAHTLEMQFETPSGVRLLPEGPMDVAAVPAPPNLAPGEEQYVQTVFALGGVPIIETGIHRFSIRRNGELVRDFALPVALVDGGGAAAAPSQPNRAERRRQQRGGRRGTS